MRWWGLCFVVASCACSGDGGMGGARDGASESNAGDGDGDGDAVAGECGAQPLELRPFERYVFVIDGGSGMNMPLGATAQTRWQALREALFGADGVVTTRASTTELGLAIYGSTPSCPLPLDVIAPATGNAAALAAAYPENAPGTASPLGPVLDEFPTRFWEGAASTMLIVITASEPKPCVDESAPADWAGAYVATDNAQFAGFSLRFVGVDAQLPSAELQKLANLGAGLDADDTRMLAPFVQATTAAALRDGIAASIDSQSACTFDFNAAIRPERANEGTFTINGSAVPLSVDGWMLSTPSRVVFQGAACASLRADPAAVVAARFPCDAYQRLPGE